MKMIMKNHLYYKSKFDENIEFLLMIIFLLYRIEIKNQTFFFFDIDDRLKGKFCFFCKN
jgi:hypothetical protein